MAVRAARVDVHTHLLPGIDDGCPSFEDAVACARILVDAGYSHAFCTPHIWPNLPHNNVQTIGAAVQRLQARLHEARVPLELMPGGELNLLSCWPDIERWKPDQIVTYNLAGRYALFDFWASRLGECRSTLADAIERLQSFGLTLVLAHPERIAALHAESAAIDWFTDRGVLLQLNSWCLTERRGSPTFELASSLLRDGRYFLIGTDLHNAASMPNRIRGLSVAESLAGEAEVRRLTVENPRRLWESGAIDPAAAAHGAEGAAGSPGRVGRDSE